MKQHQFYDKYKRNKEAKRFYNGTPWKMRRKLTLIRDKYLCQKCFRKGIITPANTVHHIKSLEEFPELALDLENLETICPSCHNKEHPEKGYGKKKIEKKAKVKVISTIANNEVF